MESGVIRLPLVDFIEEAAAAGVRALELRDKSFTERERFYTAKALAPMLKAKDILFIVNNSLDIALATGADGVHLGPADFPPEAVKPLSKRLIVGCSCNSIDEAESLSKLDIDYIAVGPLFPTSTKSDHRSLLGVKGCSEILEAIPANIEKAVIGGINEKNLHEAISLKCGICISQAICASPSPYESIRRILEIIDCA